MKLIVAIVLAFRGVVDLDAQLKDLQIGSRPLTDADMQKYVAITKEITKTRRELKGDTSPVAAQKIRQTTIVASAPHGWGSLDYSAVNARVTAAMTLLRLEKQMPIPVDKKADVDLVRKWKDQIDEARKV